MKVQFNVIDEFLEEAKIHASGWPLKGTPRRPIARITWHSHTSPDLPWKVLILVAAFVGDHGYLVELRARGGEILPHDMPDPIEAERAEQRRKMVAKVEEGLKAAGFEVRSGRYIIEEE